MDQKGEVLLGTFLVVFIATFLAWGAVEAMKSCRFSCKLDLPKYQEIGGVYRYGESHKIASTGLLGPVFRRERGVNGTNPKIR